MTDSPQQKLFEDPLHEKEIFASEVVGVAFVHGNVVVTLANARFEAPRNSFKTFRGLPHKSKRPRRPSKANLIKSSSPLRPASRFGASG